MKQELLCKMRTALYDVALPKYFELLTEFGENGNIEFSDEWFRNIEETELDNFPGGRAKALGLLADFTSDITHNDNNRYGGHITLKVYPQGFLTYTTILRTMGRQEMFFCTFEDFLQLRMSFNYIMNFSQRILGQLQEYENRINEMNSLTTMLGRFTASATRSVILEKHNDKGKLIHGIFTSDDGVSYQFQSGEYIRSIHKAGQASIIDTRNTIPDYMMPIAHGGAVGIYVNADGTIQERRTYAQMPQPYINTYPF